MLASHCLPVFPQLAETCNAPMLQIQDVPKTELVRQAGNCMSLPCLGAVLIACILCVSPKD